ncbi:MAG TPA: hypothetical protein VIX81_01560 [Gammaproteobacteria bacterium]
MIKQILTVTALTLALSGPALARHCPKDAKAIDAALPSSSLSAEDKGKVQALRDEGMALHTNGDHPASEAKMAEAMKLLGIGAK